MSKKDFSRRKFISVVSAGSVGMAAAASVPAFGSFSKSNSNAGKLALLGGDPVRRNKSWPDWPYVDEKVVESIEKTTRSGIWCRIQSATGTVPTFEKAYAELMEAKYCVAVGSGTQALHTAVEALGIGPGDEVITSPYTDPGTIAAILSARALPVLADLDPDSYQLDPADVEKRINENTKAIMPVHMMGQPADLDKFMAMAKRHNLYVIEDACQAHLARHRGKILGNIGNLGCFSFQTSKTISCGEGGAIIGDDEELMDICYTVQNHGTSRKGRTERIGPKYRMNEFEAAILLGQLEGAKERFERRNANANYLSEKLKGFPGIVPQKLYDGTESGSFYLYPMTYNKEYFNDLDRNTFLKVIAAEGVGLSGYIKNGLHKEPWVDTIISQKMYQKMYSPARLRQFKEGMDLPMCDQVCEDMLMLWASGPLLGTKEDMDDVINAIMKIYENRDQLKSLKS
ncbi:MAG: DegT/DnrJ/EryC1/StrS family aminotransferase [Prolixibacteraceae bacterium]|jgi:dTDP-4-amino-4,6-dideoxygalactose transaminase|nr:DegT/DnrJ/EryC1/StrS family aminotransferase [Prolixibacteraceae bacterium]MDD4755859.1 DegT/DnrJ/EryC1/StrS family aminotransferase [Prolixibacteraceae bacterium]